MWTHDVSNEEGLVWKGWWKQCVSAWVEITSWGGDAREMQGASYLSIPQACFRQCVFAIILYLRSNSHKNLVHLYYREQGSLKASWLEALDHCLWTNRRLLLSTWEFIRQRTGLKSSKWPRIPTIVLTLLFVQEVNFGCQFAMKLKINIQEALSILWLKKSVQIGPYFLPPWKCATRAHTKLWWKILWESLRWSDEQSVIFMHLPSVENLPR